LPALEETTRTQVERILNSDTFQNAEALRRLLRYLADKSLSGEDGQLKEYTIGLDAFGKPPSYDPQHDSIVRLHAGRLRQKLAEYYRTEGKDDSFIVELPKGHFKLTCEVRGAAVEPPSEPIANPAAQTSPSARWNFLTKVLCAALLISVAWGVYATGELWSERRKGSIQLRLGWTPELEKLWRPFIGTNRQLILAIEDPLFVELKGTDTYYRDKSLNRWEDVISSPKVAAIRKAFNNVEIAPRYYYTDLGEVNSVFLIGRLLSLGQPNITLARSSLVYWQQFADSNVVFVGAPWFFDDQLGGMPITQAMIQDRAGIHILKPKPGEPALLMDQLPTGTAEDGEVYTLVTHTSGPLGNTDIESFTSNRTPGRVAAVHWFTDPQFARVLISKMKNASGELPRYYQLVLKVKFKDGVPTDTAYVMHRELTLNGPTQIQNNQ
jgi:hypothetical protein